MTTLQKVVTAGMLLASMGAGVYEGRQVLNARGAAQTLQQQQALMAEQIQQLQREREDNARQLASLREQNASLHSATAELLKLRAEAGTLRSSVEQAKQAESDPTL